MTTHLTTFADSSMNKAAELCLESAKQHGVHRAVRALPAAPTTERGYGFWRWKAAIIDDLLSGGGLNDGDILIYADAGIEFIDNVNYIIDRMDQDIFLFANHWEHAHWCKRDIVEAIWPEADGWDRFGKQVQASVIFFRVSNVTRAVVKEWLYWCQFDGGRLIDDSPSRAANHPEFQENRHDQAILTTLAYKYGFKLHWWPAMYNAWSEPKFVYFKDWHTDDYPPLVHHHRLRDSEWPNHKEQTNGVTQADN